MIPSHCREARLLLGWKQQRLAVRSGICTSTVRAFETGQRQMQPQNVMAVRATLEAAGVEFIVQNGGGLGVRLRVPAA